MKTFFTVKQADDTESWSGRFYAKNDDLNISKYGHNLMQVINEFLSEFKEEYYYWQNIYDKDLNEGALITKNKFMEYGNAYERCHIIKKEEE